MAAGAGPVAEVVVASASVDRLVAFLGLVGLEQVATVPITAEVASELYGIEDLAATDGPVSGSPRRTVAVRLAAPGAGDHATVLIVPTINSADAVGGWSHGPRALDLYTTDLDESLRILGDAGFPASPEAVLEGGPMRMRQSLVVGPGSFPLVLVESTHRRSSICDLPDGPLHSEPHSVVWCVADHVDEVARWTAAGWTAGTTINFAEPSVSDELGLADRPTPITMTMLSDEQVNPTRVELMTFDDHADGAPVAEPALRALVVRVEDLAAARAAWSGGATFGSEARTPEGPAIAGVTGGGVRLVLVGRG